MPAKFNVLPESARRMACLRTAGAWKTYIGQNQAVERLLDLQYQAWSNEEHLVPENIMFAGPPSVGKTALVKVLASEICTPLLTTDANQLNSGVTIAGRRIAGGPDTLIHLIHETWARTPYGPMAGCVSGNFSFYRIPAMIIFVDEIHGLNRRIADAMLKATERADAQLFGKSSILDCRNVLWVGATTDWGKLPSAFRTRFLRIDLLPPTKEEVSKIVHLNNPSFSSSLCDKIVYFGSTVPREALAFARSVIRYSQRMGVQPSDCIMACAEREGIDKWGMRKQRIDILQALKQSPDGLILRNLSSAVALEADEVVKHWLPALMFAKPPLVQNERSRYRITDAGEAELAKRS